MSFSTWCDGVLIGVKAPNSAVGQESLTSWATAETGPYPLMRWNNPLNSTEKWPGSVDSGAQPGPDDVQIYATEQDGINATVATLRNGKYPTIVANLQSELPTHWWQNACADLEEWGTGCNWLGGNPLATVDQVYTELRGDQPYSKLDLIQARLGLPSPALDTGAHLPGQVVPFWKDPSFPTGGGSDTDLTNITLDIPSVPGTATGKLS